MARIVINPSTFRNEKDGLCIAFDEAFRIVMEELGFRPDSEPTDVQRKFFSDTAYNDDELQLRRTIIARICTFDTSVRDPTDEQLAEAVQFLEDVMEAGFPQNEWEQGAVQRIHDVLAKSVGAEPAPAPVAPVGSPANAMAGGGDSRLVRAAVDAEDEEKAKEAEEHAEEEREDAEAGRPQQTPELRENIKDIGRIDAKGEYVSAGKIYDEQGRLVGYGGTSDSVQKAQDVGLSVVPAKPDGSDLTARRPAIRPRQAPDGRTIDGEGNLRTGDGRIDNFGAQNIRGTAFYGQGYAQTERMQTVPDGKSEWQRKRDESRAASDQRRMEGAARRGETGTGERDAHVLETPPGGGQTVASAGRRPTARELEWQRKREESLREAEERRRLGSIRRSRNG